MKGIKIERAKPSNFIDIYALFKELVKEGVYLHPKPTERQVKDYGIKLLDHLNDQYQFLFLARKGRQYVGFIHAMILPREFGDPYIGFIRTVYVTPKRRKLGIAKDLIDQAMEVFRSLGLKKVEFGCDDQLVEYWMKKRGAKKVLNILSVEVE